MLLPNLTLYLGGTRSGKSALAEAQAMRHGGPVLYVATAEARTEDASMTERIRRHRERRPAHWQTLECPLHPAPAIEHALTVLWPASARHAGHADRENAPPTVLLDCVTLWVCNLLFALPDQQNLPALEQAVTEDVTALLDLMRRLPCQWIVVSGEVGLGGIAADSLSRHYADGLGLANQLLGAHAGTAWLVLAGRRLRLEPGLPA